MSYDFPFKFFEELDEGLSNVRLLSDLGIEFAILSKSANGIAIVRRLELNDRILLLLGLPCVSRCSLAVEAHFVNPVEEHILFV